MITYTDKDLSANVGTPERTFRAQDANEIKSQHNTLESRVNDIEGIISVFQVSYTQLTGGDSDSLDSIPTESLAVNSVAAVLANGALTFWVLQAGTTAEDGVDVVRPDDYEDVNNEKIWVPAL